MLFDPSVPDPELPPSPEPLDVEGPDGLPEPADPPSPLELPLPPGELLEPAKLAPDVVPPSEPPLRPRSPLGEPPSWPPDDP